jgi:glycerate kinase
MRILVAPDKYAGTLSAVQAAEAIATGWRRTAPGDELDLAPVSDGGPGFLDVLHAGLGGDLVGLTVSGPFGEPVPAAVLRVGTTAYVESAQACGLHLTGGRRGEDATTYGVGQLLAAALDAGATRVVVGLGGSGSNDGGAGLLAALGAHADVPLDRGVAGLRGLTEITLPARLDVELVAASDVSNPLTGLFGATKVFGPQKGIADLLAADAALEALAAAAGRITSLEKGAGAAGGLGYALLLLGATRRPGLDVVADAVDLRTRMRRADLVLTGEGAFDATSRGGKVPVAIAELAAQHARPCVVLAGRVEMGIREARSLGIEAAYSVVDVTGEERALGDPHPSLAALAERVARTWHLGE